MQYPRFASIAGCLKHGRVFRISIKVIIIHIGENDIRGYSTPFAVAMRLGEMAAFEIFELFLSEKQNRGMLFECPSSLQETAMVERSRKSRPTAGFCATQRGRRRASSTIDEFVADERGKFPASQSLENSENAERISLRQSPIRSICRAVPCLPGNGAATA